MNTKVVPLRRLEEDLRPILEECLATDVPVVVEMPDGRLLLIQSLDPADEDDDFISNLIESNPAFRALLERSNASPRVPFSIADED